MYKGKITAKKCGTAKSRSKNSFYHCKEAYWPVAYSNIVRRILWYTTSLRTLEIHSEKVDVRRVRPSLWTSTPRDTVPFALFTGIDFSNCPNLEVITCRGFAFVEADLLMLRTAPKCKALMIFAGEFNALTSIARTVANLASKLTYLAIRDSDLKGKFQNIDPGSILFRVCSNPTKLDLRSCSYHQVVHMASTTMQKVCRETSKIYLTRMYLSTKTNTTSSN